MRADINKALRELMKDERVVLIGQSIRDPYGGASKITRGLSKKYPDRVIDTPISEASMIGMSLGMAYGGLIPIVEIMFADFLTLCADQLFNIAKKLDELHGVDFTLIIRTMQGTPEYGATHSQDMRHFLDGLGIPYFVCQGDVLKLYKEIIDLHKIAVIIEKKQDYENSNTNSR